MTKTARSRQGTPGFTLGRQAFARISAVEGIHLSADMEVRFSEFDRKALSGAERRKALRQEFGHKG